MDLIHQITSIERSGHRNIVHGMYCEECDLRISGLETNLIRVLIGALVLYGSGPPLTQHNNKRGARWGTGTNVHRAHSAPTNPSN
jgi:hypothetical protein